MADLNNLQAAGSTIIVGSDLNGLETNAVNSTTTGDIHSALVGVVDSGNSTSSNLGVSGVFTGTWTDILTYNNIVITIRASHISAIDGFVIQWSNDGSVIHSTDEFNLAANAGKQYSFGRLTRYYRIVYTNGIATQTSFSLQTILCRGDLKPSSHSVNDSIVPDDAAQLVKATITGKAVDGNYYNVAVDTEGRIITSSVTGYGSDFAFGDITSASTTKKIVRRTTYTEQTSNAQRSVVSSSANDAAAGTGSRTISITYLDSTGAGPFLEVITLNGVTPVNTVNTNICFIEQIEVLTAGSTLSNVGTISLKAASAGGGATIGTISPTDNQTFWTHHYIPVGKICNITGISCGHSGTTVGSGGLITVNGHLIGVANAVERQISDFIRLYGQDSTISRSYTSPIKVSGPCRLFAYVTPETATSTVYRCAIDFFEP